MSAPCWPIGANQRAARVSGINIGRHLIRVDAVAGLLSGLAGVVTSGFTLLKVGSSYQGIVKGAIILAAVIIDPYRQRRRKRA